MLDKKINSEVTMWFVTHTCLSFTFWVTDSLIKINEALTKNKDCNLRPDWEVIKFLEI